MPFKEVLAIFGEETIVAIYEHGVARWHHGMSTMQTNLSLNWLSELTVRGRTGRGQNPGRHSEVLGWEACWVSGAVLSNPLLFPLSIPVVESIQGLGSNLPLALSLGPLVANNFFFLSWHLASSGRKADLLPPEAKLGSHWGGSREARLSPCSKSENSFF